jgi:hypothetical protein
MAPLPPGISVAGCGRALIGWCTLVGGGLMAQALRHSAAALLIIAKIKRNFFIVGLDGYLELSQFLQHLVGGLYRFRIDFVSALRLYHVDQLFYHVNVGRLQHGLVN